MTSFPERIYPLVKRDLDTMQTDDRKSTFCFPKFIDSLKRKNESIEKYVNWALQLKQLSSATTIALEEVYNHLYPSSKKHVLVLFMSKDKIYTCKDILIVLSKYKLNKTTVFDWYQKTGQHIVYDKKIRQFDIEVWLKKMGIDLDKIDRQ